MRFSLVVAGSVETVNRTAIRQSVAAAVGIGVSSVRIELTAASVAVDVTIEAASRSAAMSTMSLLDTHLQNATSAGELLQMSVESIVPPTVVSLPRHAATRAATRPATAITSTASGAAAGSGPFRHHHPSDRLGRVRHHLLARSDHLLPLRAHAPLPPRACQSVEGGEDGEDGQHP